jgi:small acid-soluble spore protein tlp
MKEMIEDTKERMESSENYMKDNDVRGEQKMRMQEKNEHRREAIENWQEEIREESTRL